HAATPAALSLISSGTQFLGVPYRFGAPAGVTYAFDCSSFIQYVFKASGIKLPRTSVAQATAGKKVAKGYLSTGDLVFFNTGGAGISHVAIYAGNGKILHSSSTKGVTIASMNTTYWQSKYVTARRVL
ncbi:C40 family peptidase, partial [Paenibacillus sepulcri]|nr:C40 family peptidase [Paenibacillus sepulcri]